MYQKPCVETLSSPIEIGFNQTSGGPSAPVFPECDSGEFAVDTWQIDVSNEGSGPTVQITVDAEDPATQVGLSDFVLCQEPANPANSTLAPIGGQILVAIYASGSPAGAYSFNAVPTNCTITNVTRISSVCSQEDCDGS
jgi:hypothetical protein